MPITAVMFKPRAQAKEVERLQAYAQRLDGTVIHAVDEEGEPETDYDKYPDKAFRACADRMAGRRFIYLEADSIPLQRGWAEKLTNEFLLKARPFLLTTDSQLPYDRISGIGVYGKETRWIIPKVIPHDSSSWFHAWDGWLIEHIPHLVARTSLIQHSYGHYDEKGIASPHRFPRDRSLIRSTSVIFHKDKFQELIP